MENQEGHSQDDDNLIRSIQRGVFSASTLNVIFLKLNSIYVCNAIVAELADALGLELSGEIRVGSTPISSTNFEESYPP